MELSPYAGLYDLIIEKDNFWKQMNEMVDLGFIYEQIQQNYSETWGQIQSKC